MPNQEFKLSKNQRLAAICFGILAVAFVAVIVFKVPVTTVFYFGLIALCPLMHLFMMRGHGHGQEHEDSQEHDHGQGTKTPLPVEQRPSGDRYGFHS